MTLHKLCDIEQEILKLQERIKEERDSMDDGSTIHIMTQRCSLQNLYSKLTECRSIIINMRLDL